MAEQANAMTNATRGTCSRETSTYRVGGSAGPFGSASVFTRSTAPESRMLATVGAFRVVSESDLHNGREDTRRAQRHLEQEGLRIVSTQLGRPRWSALRSAGRDLLEATGTSQNARGRRARLYAGP